MKAGFILSARTKRIVKKSCVNLKAYHIQERPSRQKYEKNYMGGSDDKK